ncbi:unnamed protein product [Prorocentrum cordatum]|uniref:Protein kinase domain-containing protein n=1 Tax=Prorocentrum cordatum TaxID=2364126 RepID=A0ABN9TRF1_9DINO|nr:unnamed protein product [Polarella glacialis]
MERIKLQDTSVTLKELKHVKVIGIGSAGTVRLVQHKQTQMRYALKRVRKKQNKVPSEVARECKLLAENDHPMVMHLVKTFETSKSVYMLTELITGGELHAAIRKIPTVLSRVQSQFYTGSLVLVLEALADRFIVYRDLKPENVMLDAQGYLKLVDFGISKKLQPSKPQTFTVIGTPHYMAPEILTGRGYSLEVVDKSSKTSQGNRGDYVVEQNLEVHLHREPHVALEFEITRNNHMKHMEGRPYTETAMFKDPPPKRHHAAAWRVFLHAVKGRELLPQHARDYCKSGLTRHGTWEDDVLPEGLEGIPLEPGFPSPAGSSSSPTQAPGLPTAPGLASSPTQAPSRKPTFPYPFQNAPAMPGGQATASAARVEPCPTESASMSQGGRGAPLEPGFASSAGVGASMNQGGATGPPAKKSKAAPGGAPIAPAAQVSGGARQASCPEGLNYCEAGVTELRAFERGGNIASLVKAQDLLLKGIERISDVLPEGRDLDGTEYETPGAEFNRFAEIAGDARAHADRVGGGKKGSGPGFARPATQGQQNEDKADAEKTPPGFDPEADWTEDTADAHQFDITADLREELAEKPDGDPAAARESREARAALGAEVLPIPDFLKLVQGQPMASNAALDDVRAMKSRGVEHARRRVVDEPDDPEVQDNIDRMRREAWEKHEERRRTCARGLDTRDMFLGRELVYVKLVSAVAVPMAREGRLRMLALREHYRTFFKELPDKAAQKFSPNQLGDDDGPSKALLGLVNHHFGEVVELDGCRTQRCLRKVAPGIASAAQFENPQFWRVQGGYTVGRRPEGRCEHGRRGSELFAKAVDAQAQREAAAVNEGEDINPQVYMPAWARQWSRVCVPCEAVETHEWCRQSPATTLGELFTEVPGNLN